MDTVTSEPRRSWIHASQTRLRKASFPAHAAAVAPRAARLILAVALLGAIVAAFAWAASSPHMASDSDPDLTRLLRAMAIIKAGMALGLIAAMYWRLGIASSRWALAAYAASAAAAVSGPILIWGMTNLVFGALLLHGGLLAGALTLWRDPATTNRLESLISWRRHSQDANSSRGASRPGGLR